MATLKQKRARIYKDFDFAFGKNAITGDLNKKLDVNAVKQSMKNLVLTKYYERPFQPDIGSELGSLLFENADMFTADRISKSLEYLFRNYEKRARINSIDIEPNVDRNEYNVDIRFSVVGINSPEQLQVKLERLR
jgi:phage baseplate assembly protein W